MDSSNLKLDKNIHHPFVRVHIVNLKTGLYIEKTQDKKNVFYSDEHITDYGEGEAFPKQSKSYSGVWFVYFNIGIRYIMPMQTNCANLRIKGTSRA